jgi:NTP-dependent ternary system trypsin peptidase co-occuring protein
MPSKVVEVVLPNKAVALVQAADLDEGTELQEDEGVAEKVGWKDTFDLEQVAGTLEGIAQAIRSGLEKAMPNKTTVELGIELAIKNGMLTSMLVDGKADASLKVTLEWGSQRLPGEEYLGQPGAEPADRPVSPVRDMHQRHRGQISGDRFFRRPGPGTYLRACCAWCTRVAGAVAGSYRHAGGGGCGAAA